jgi:hypothetical protein
MPGQKKRSLRALSHFLPSQETQLLLRLKRFAFLLSLEQEKGRFARHCRSFSRYKALKMSFHAIVLQF